MCIKELIFCYFCCVCLQVLVLTLKPELEVLFTHTLKVQMLEVALKVVNL